MRKLSFLLIVSILVFHTGLALADKEQAVFAIQKAKSSIEKVKVKSEEMKAPVAGLKKADEFLGQAEALLKNNTNILGKLKKEAETDILYFAEMAEISAATVLSGLEKVNQEKENARLEKTIPEIEAKIKVFMDKNAEIQRLTEELKKPKGSMQALNGEISQLKGSIQTLNGEITQLKKDKTDLADQASRLKLERENVSGKLEALTGVFAANKKELSEKARTAEELTAENRRLKDDLKALQTQKGSDILETRAKLQDANRKVEFLNALGGLDYLTKRSEKGCTFVIPRKVLIKSTPKGPALAPGAEERLVKLAELAKAFPGSQFKIDVYGFGNPPKGEDNKATQPMAQLLKKTFIEKGVNESAVQATGRGSDSPLFSKGAIEENRRVEITVYQ